MVEWVSNLESQNLRRNHPLQASLSTYAGRPEASSGQACVDDKEVEVGQNFVEFDDDLVSLVGCVGDPTRTPE